MTDPRGAGHRPPLRRHPVVACAAALILALPASACQSRPEGEASGPAAAPGTSAAGPGGAPAGAGEDKPLDACTLLTEAEITPVIGANDGGRGNGASVDGSNCSWENPDTFHSITVSIGAAGTAASGQLPAKSDYGQTEPGPDGIRFAAGNVAEFVAGDRVCEIQVVTSVTSNSDRPTAVRLIGMIRGRL